jgi:uncharacterized membrane-anchored protein
MRKALVLAAVILQLVVLAYMAGEREYILRNGKVIHLRTAPVDPRDLFRGDYVSLNYEISRISVDALTGAADAREIKKGDRLYAVLQEGANGLYELARIQLQPPENGVYLSGRFRHAHQILQPGYPAWITYGIEAYFIEQGTGRAIETRRGNRTGVQVPLEMAVAVSKNGTAVLKGYRWSPIGIGLQVLRSPEGGRRDPQAPKSATVRVTLANTADKPLAIVALPDDCSYSLEPVSWAKQHWLPANSSCNAPAPRDSDVVVLEPGEEKTVDLDFSTDRWLVQADDSVHEIGALDWSEQFRIVYRPPNEADCAHLEQRALIWHGYLPSRVFHGRGQID